MSKETYTCVKRDLHMCHKRPTHVSKETYTCVKRDLDIRETDKRDQHTRETNTREADNVSLS